MKSTTNADWPRVVEENLDAAIDLLAATRDGANARLAKARSTHRDASWSGAVLPKHRHIEDQGNHLLEVLRQRSIRRAKEDASIMEGETIKHQVRRRWVRRPEHNARKVLWIG